MSLETEIVPYIDGGGYVAPNLVPVGQMRGGDNGTCFTSEYYILMEKNHPTDDWSKPRADGWEKLIRSCMPIPGLTVRFPGDKALDAPDNLYSILAASKILNKPQVADDILLYGITHYGFYNPTDKFQWAAFQWRQPQLLFAMLCASNNYKWYKFFQWPLAVHTALTILVSCYNTPKGDTDPRRLSWLLIQTVKNDSWLCKVASYFWYKRLYNVYTNGMKDVASIYYKDNHPFTRYWVDV